MKQIIIIVSLIITGGSTGKEIDDITTFSDLQDFFENTTKYREITDTYTNSNSADSKSTNSEIPNLTDILNKGGWLFFG